MRSRPSVAGLLHPEDEVEKTPTGISGLDVISYGGLPSSRLTLVSGTAGAGKTIFACQFLAEGIRLGIPGVFVTFEESVEDIRRNTSGLGFPIQQWEQEGRWAFVDGAPSDVERPVESGPFDLEGLISRISHAADRVGAKRVSIDSLGALFNHFVSADTIRQEVYRLATALKAIGVTAVLTAERDLDYGPVSKWGVEEFVSDNVVILRNALTGEHRRRSIEILKMRGAMHHTGQYPYTVVPQQGIVMIPSAAMELTSHGSGHRITTGSDQLDRMLHGGLYDDSIVLLSGATGTGKTLMATHFVAGGLERGERSLLLAYEEGREQLFRNAVGWGFDLEQYEASGDLLVVNDYPESASLENHLLHVRRVVSEFQPNRVAVDSLSALERGSTDASFREFVIALTSFLKQERAAAMFTSTTASLMGGASVTDAHISTLTDAIILLRYVELAGQMRRGLTVLKMRGSMHDKDIREFTINGEGIHLGSAFHGVSGILAGNPRQITSDEVTRIETLFDD
ncbi:circadian clock protein KaiC [Euzebya tangerina]|uniref:circadian clock protein KaiC n=1 Tax=Euzebya tangerina TaxID=591198 RepID=UPI000E31DFD8|nr:circadian clock protein KaiC [Euzebya tangerina]